MAAYCTHPSWRRDKESLRKYASVQVKHLKLNKEDLFHTGGTIILFTIIVFIYASPHCYRETMPLTKLSFLCLLSIIPQLMQWSQVFPKATIWELSTPVQWSCTELPLCPSCVTFSSYLSACSYPHSRAQLATLRNSQGSQARKNVVTLIWLHGIITISKSIASTIGIFSFVYWPIKGRVLGAHDSEGP